VADDEEEGARVPSRDAVVEEEFEVPDAVAEDGHGFGGTGPGHAALAHGALGDQVRPGEKVEVEAGHGHDGVVGVFLVAHGEGGEAVPGERDVVVGGLDGGEKGGGGGEERDVLDVGIVFLVVWLAR